MGLWESQGSMGMHAHGNHMGKTMLQGRTQHPRFPETCGVKGIEYVLTSLRLR